LRQGRRRGVAARRDLREEILLPGEAAQLPDAEAGTEDDAQQGADQQNEMPTQQR
jgi:hypothetical protein